MVENTGGSVYRKRAQKDYSLAFKMQVIDDVEKGRLTYKEAQRHYGIQGRTTVLVWLRKHGSLDWNNTGPMAGKGNTAQKNQGAGKAHQASGSGKAHSQYCN